MSEPATALKILAHAAAQPAGKLTTCTIAGRRLAIVDADWLDEFKRQAAADEFRARWGSIFGGAH